MPEGGGVFISYRRTDSRYPTEDLACALKKVFGEKQVFLDVANVPMGRPVQDALVEAVGSCRVMLVVIGNSWLKEIDLRAAQVKPAPDYVVIEIALALSSGLEVIPVLLEEVTRPDEASLPASIQALSTLQAHQQTKKYWDKDLEKLREHLETQSGVLPKPPFAIDWTRIRTQVRRVARSPVLIGTLAIGLVAGFVIWRSHNPPAPPIPDNDSFDIAFLVPPDGADAQDAKKVFNELQGVLKLALDSPTVELVPENLKPEDFENYQLGKEALLTYTSPKGQVDLFIASTNGLDPAAKTRKLVLTPYLRRPQNPQRLRLIRDWPDKEFVGPTDAKDVAFKAAFELIEFLADKHLVRLKEEELTQARLFLLTGYRRQLRLRTGVCDPLKEVLVQLKDPKQRATTAENAKLTREIFDVECEPGEGPSALASADVFLTRQLGSK